MINIKNIADEYLEGYYWAEGVEVMGNYGDTHTFTFCMCRNYKEAKDVSRGLNLLDNLIEDGIEIKEEDERRNI